MEYNDRFAASCFAAALTLIRGVEVPLVLVEASGVAEPERAGVPRIGRLLEMIPVVVRLNSTAGVEEPESEVAS